MSPDPLERKLADYARQSLPAAPDDIAAGVWREIDRRRGQTFTPRIGWRELLARPGWGIAGLIFAVAAGAAPALAFAKAQQARRLAQQSLHLDVFSLQTAGEVTSVLAAPDRSPTQQPLP